MKDYQTIFGVMESTLIEMGSKNLPPEMIKQRFDEFKFSGFKRLEDKEYFWMLVRVIFYSGFKAETVNRKLDVIKKYLIDYRKVSAYSSENVEKMMADTDMIKNKRKILSCIESAKEYKQIVENYGSFADYIPTFSDSFELFENVMLLKEELEYRFAGLGRVTTYHFMTMMGLPVLKPDTVICRLFQRIGFIENEAQLLKTVIIGKIIANQTGYPIRYIDIILVTYGQVESSYFGIERGICLKNPNCDVCRISKFCKHFSVLDRKVSI